MLLKEYKDFINDLITATNQNKMQWSRGNSPSSFLATPDGKRKILIDTYNAQVDNSVNTCINLALFDAPTNRLLDEIVICDQTGQIDDYNLISAFYQLVKKQYSDKAISPILTEITQSLR